AGPAPRRRPQDRERGARHVVWKERGASGRHPRPAARDAARPDEGEGPGEDRARPDGARAARQVDVVLAHPDPAWASRVHRSAAEMRGVRGESTVSELARMNRSTTPRRHLARESGTTLGRSWNAASGNVQR